MFQKTNRSNPILKIISFFICVTLIIGIAPTSVLSNLWVSAAEEPKYGTYTVSADGKTLTAVPNEGAAFRGWYKNGKEVSYKSKITLSNGEKPSNYKAVFYNFNLANNPGFENQNEVWQGTAVSDTSNEQCKSGSNSLKISGSSNKNYVYKSFSDLEAETQYTVSYYYKGSSLSGFVLGGDSVSLSDFEGNKYKGKYLAKNNGAQATNWQKAELTFYTEDNTTVSLLLNLPENGTVYVDDVCLVKDVMASPTYFNEDFSNSVQNVFSSKINKTNNPVYDLSIDNKGRLKVKQNLTFGVVQFLPIKLKKGANYTIKFDLDMSDELLDESNVPILNSNGNGYLYENGQIQYNSNPNWINFSLTETQGRIGSKNNYNEWIIGPESATKSGNLFTSTISDGAKTITKRYSDGTDRSAIGFPKSFLTDKKLNVGNLKVTMKITAVKSCVAYLSACLNGRGTFYIDNINITENISNVDSIDIVSDSAIKTMGTAIRTVGIQGIRHKTQIDKRLLTGENGYGIRVIEYGTVVIRTAVLGDEDLFIDKKDYYYQNNNYQSAKGVAYSFKDGTDVVYEDAQTTIDFTGVLTNIPFEKWNEDYTARAYFKYVDKNGKEDILYFKPHSMAVYPISKEAYSNRNDDGEFAESNEVRQFLYKNIISKFTDKTVKVSDNSKPIYNNFQGIRSTVYHGTMFFPDSHGRTYTESQAAVEMDRLADSKVDNVRTRLASQWMWEDGTGWNWDSEKMQAFYKWAKMLKDRNISITLNAGWHLHDFLFFYDTKISNDKRGYEAAYGDKDGNGHSSIPEVNYLHGYTDAGEKIEAKYREYYLADKLTQIGKELNLFKEGETYDESKYAYFSVAAARYAVWIKQALNAFKANGVDNVEYVLPFTETGYAINMGKDENGNKIYANDFTYDEWIFMTAAL
ncbi:MAG: hypothetical protein U0L55_00810, partial [Acutalibacteraceae bacterium]|nr:hypothetical protein [Acutalibacteraceae bacterium]